MYHLLINKKVTPSASYSYLPAYKRFFPDIKVLHFIGADKPWMMERYTDGTVIGKGGDAWRFMIEKWWGVYDGYYRGIREALEVCLTVLWLDAACSCT
jgi:glycogenin glucosyltransferase